MLQKLDMKRCLEIRRGKVFAFMSPNTHDFSRGGDDSTEMSQQTIRWIALRRMMPVDCGEPLTFPVPP